jgi:iron complex transport system substrate-binding protein
LRIYSFLPSATEIVYALGLGDQLCGVTHECDYPAEAATKPVVVRSRNSSAKSQREIDDLVAQSVSHGHGLYSIDRALLERVKPDVVITQELCDVCSVSLRDVLKTVNELSQECNVVSLKPRGLEGVLEDILTVGKACHAEERALALVDSLRRRIRAVETKAKGLARPRVFCVEWFDPVFASGHWVPEMVEIAGGHDALGRPGEDSRRISWEDVVSYDPETLVLIPCGFDTRRTTDDLPLLAARPGWSAIQAVRAGKVYATDGSAYYSRPGPRLVDGLEMMAKMIHPEVFGSDLPPEAARRLSVRVLGLA